MAVINWSDGEEIGVEIVNSFYAQMQKQLFWQFWKIAENSISGAQVLLDLSEKAREILKDEKLPKDLSINHDYYLWGGRKRKA